MLPIKKLYIDTRLKSPDSKSNSNFSVDLPTTLLMPDNTVFYVDDVTIPVSWYNIDENNNNIYVQFKFDGDPTPVYRQKTFAVGNYSILSLAAALEQAIEYMLLVAGHGSLGVTATPLIDNNTIRITTSQSGWQFKILSDKELEQTSHNFARPFASINSVISNQQADLATTLTIGPIDLHQVRNVYIHSPNLATYSTLSLSGARDIIKKVPVNANYNELIFNNIMVAQDY